MKNQLSDLNNYLFEQIERLNNDDLSAENFDKEIKRSEAITKVSKAIIDNARLALSAQKHYDDMGRDIIVDNPLLESK